MLPFDKLKASFFYPSRVENKDTFPNVIKIVVELANCLLAKLHDPKKATSNYLRSAERKFIWVQTTDEEHKALISMMATNDPAESPFAALTRQLEQYGRVLRIHSDAIGHARTNCDFDQGDLKNPNNKGKYHNLHS